jgi:hypothetical protein
MIEAPIWFIIIMNILLFGFAPVFVGFFIKCWWNVKRTKGSMVGEVWEPNGDTTRELVKPDPTGATVTINELIYRLPKELSNKELSELQANKVHVYPRKRWYFMHNWPLPPIPLRIESWEHNNPEPVRPFYGRIAEDGKFEDSLLTVTSTEWAAQKNVIQGTQIAMRMQALEAWQKALQNLIANMPAKLIVYLGLGIAALAGIVAVIMLYQMSGAGG